MYNKQNGSLLKASRTKSGSVTKVFAMEKFPTFNKLRDSISSLVFHTGLDPFATNRNIIWKCTIPIYFTFYWGCAFFTIYNSAKENIAISISTGGSTIGIALQAVATITTFYLHRNTFRDQFDNLVQFYEGLSTMECKYVQEKLQVMETFCKYYISICFFTIGLVMFAPLIPGNTQSLPLVLDIPFLNSTKSPDYQLTYLLQATFLFYSVRYFCGFHELCIIFVFHYGLLIDLMVERMGNNSATVRDLIKHHKKIVSFHNVIEDVFALFITTQIICTVYPVTLGLYVCIFYKLFQNYILIVLSFGQLFVTCTYGSYFQRKSERLVVAIFNSIRWNELSWNDQKSIKLMLLMAQQRCQLRIGPGGYFELSYELYLKVNGHVNK